MRLSRRDLMTAVSLTPLAVAVNRFRGVEPRTPTVAATAPLASDGIALYPSSVIWAGDILILDGHDAAWIAGVSGDSATLYRTVGAAPVSATA